ncbi:PREDICTED: uncharacterized protein LOC104607235 isoform X2 [Nelumbo nucifera]|uniref:Uncharacterized protein LOC104607235 isoform X2 n=1 Tax=Nelumbo nucifera TaxID=4432 RepID=A0A1U8AWU3_NELNU|nr:PREDICTED: uncharacterized protein LOC104607235 isoform X2 [Nelumbo nucifera]
MEERRPRRLSLKSHRPNWKTKLLENCIKRVEKDRIRLLWKMRSTVDPSLNQKIMESAFRDIVSDELKRFKDSPMNNGRSEITPSNFEDNDTLWEYDPMVCQSTEGECEEIMLELQRIFYEDARMESSKRDPESHDRIYEDEEDDYLAHAVFEHMQLNKEQVDKEIWCPICKKGELQENHQIIYCTLCDLQLNRGDEVNLEILGVRLGEAHEEHLERGCKLTPKFCIETKFNLTALYIQCQACKTFEIIL